MIHLTRNLDTKGQERETIAANLSTVVEGVKFVYSLDDHWRT